MDREAGIEAYQSMITAEVYKTRRALGETGDWDHTYTNDGTSPVLRVEITQAQEMAKGITKYEFRLSDGGDLPPWQAGAHLDIVVAPEFLRQYSMSGDPSDRSKYQIGVLREHHGRGGSALLHRIFNQGRKVFISRPINHFPLEPNARHTLLMGGGIGIAPLIAMAHELHAKGASFELHYCMSSRSTAGYLDDLAAAPWAKNVSLHISDENTRADLDALLSGYASGHHIYTCGPDRFMSGVAKAAKRQKFPEDACHFEYFSVPETPEYQNHAFTLRLTDGREFQVPADQSATDILAQNGIHIDVKCADGLCGTCKCTLTTGEVEHRDYVLSNAQRKTNIILCQSRAAHADTTIEIDLPSHTKTN
jgi:ferredoxin-NADP reductase